MQLNYRVLGQRIQKIRKRKHISQAALSAMIDKSSGYISYLECGTKVMSLETFVSIANALEVSTDTLLNRQLAVATEISNTEAQKVFANCSQYETYVLLDVLKATKESLRAQKHHLHERGW
jgi:transcriptional regulator with XRE-family HTH domain